MHARINSCRIAACLLTLSLLVPVTVQAQQTAAELHNLNNRALKLLNEGNYEQSRRLYEQTILPAGKRVFGTNSLDYGVFLGNYADACGHLGKYDEAERSFKVAIPIKERVLGRESMDVAVLLNNLGLFQSDARKYDEAIQTLNRSLTIRKTRHANNPLSIAMAEHNLGQTYATVGRFAEAEPLLRQSLRTREDKLSKSHFHSCCTRRALAGVYRDTCHYEHASALFQEGLLIAQKTNNNSEIASALLGLGQVSNSAGEFNQAEEYLLRSRKMTAALPGRLASDFITVDSELATLYREHGLLDKAEPLYLQLLKTLELSGSEWQSTYADTLLDYGNLHYRRRRPVEAEQCFQKAIPILESIFGKDHFRTGRGYNNLGLLYKDLARYPEAQLLLERTLKIDESSLGPQHRSTLADRNNLALVYLRTGNFTEAASELRECVRGFEKTLGPQHPNTVMAGGSLASALGGNGDFAESARAFDTNRRLIRQSAVSVLPFLPEHEQVEFLHHTDREALDAALSLSLRAQDDHHIAQLGATWLLNSKGLSEEVQATTHALTLSSTSNSIQSVRDELSNIRGQIAGLAVLQGAESEGKVAILREKENTLVRSILKSMGTETRTKWIGIDDLRKAITGKSVFVNIARLEVLDFQATAGKIKWQPARYAAWVIPSSPNSTVTVIDLGDANATDTLVADLQKHLKQSAQRIGEVGAPTAESEYLNVAGKLSQRILAPLRDQLDGFEEWIISPDSALWLVPWAALPLDDKTYVTEKHQIRYAVSGRDLIKDASQDLLVTTPAVIVADPDFNLKRNRARLAANSRVPAQGNQDQNRGLADELRLGQIALLPGTAAEANAIELPLGKYTGLPAQMLVQQAALEEEVKKLKAPKVLVLATHGFALADLADNHARQETTDNQLPISAIGHRNPLVRCGLLLAGCNHTSSETGSMGDEGILTGLEVTSCNLRGTDLVVLSACDTGLGDIRLGEGVVGLRHAFQLAGAKSVVATLWSIPDLESAQLMQDFFQGLTDGQSKTQALRQAQLKRISAQRELYGAAHPFFWAAFTLTGKE